MKRLNVLAVGLFMVGGMILAGCDSSGTPTQDGFAGGNGAFGENPSSPGSYHSDATYHPSANEGKTAGGNGEFGESPARPGAY